MVLHLIAAACENMGIGNKGQLPWRLKKEMKFFQEKTTATINPDRQNAVIMGRKTWLSIPKNIRPLANRINVVLTTTQPDLKGAHYVTDSFKKAMEWLHSPSNKMKIDKIFVIGGEAVYKIPSIQSKLSNISENVLYGVLGVLIKRKNSTQIAMDSDYHQIIYLTRIHSDFECDAFFPKVDPEKYTKSDAYDVPQGVQEEDGIKYNYEVYIKNQN